MADNVAITPGSGANIAADDVGGVLYQRVKLAQGADDVAVDVSAAAPLRTRMPDSELVVLNITGSLGITTAAVWDEWLLWQVPATYWFKPALARAAVTTAGSRTMILAGQRLGSWNPNSNVFTDDASIAGPDFYDRMTARITTTMAATANTVTVTYTDQAGNTGNSTSALSIPSAAPAGNHYEFVLAAGDNGVRDVTAVVDTAAPASGLLEIWGWRTLFETLGAANALETHMFGVDDAIEAGESIAILLNATAVTAQQRLAAIVGSLAAV